MLTPMDFQGSLFEAPPAGAPDFAGTERRVLTRGAWVDVCRSWLPEADEVFATLVRDVPWRAERRQMYDREVDVPRLLHTYGVGDPLPHPALARARGALSAHYRPELGEPFVTAGCCYYRDGRDSVAWHGDRVYREQDVALVAVLTLGAARRFLLRPKGGGPSVKLEPAAGDLLVMGGTCQRTWQHSVPKTARPVGPRLSVTLRHRAELARSG